MQEVLVNRLEGLSLPGKSVVRLTDRPDMTLDVYRGRKTTTTTLNFVVAEIRSCGGIPEDLKCGGCGDKGMWRYTRTP